MSLPSSYTRAVFKEAGAPLTLEQVELTMPAAGEVLVKVEACGVCHSDTIPQAYGLNGQLYVIQHLRSVSSKLTSLAPLFRAMRSSAMSLRSGIKFRSGKSAIALVDPGMGATMVRRIGSRSKPNR